MNQTTEQQHALFFCVAAVAAVAAVVAVAAIAYARVCLLSVCVSADAAAHERIADTPAAAATIVTPERRPGVRQGDFPDEAQKNDGSGRQKERHPRFDLNSQERVHELIDALPGLSHARGLELQYVSLASIPDELLRQMSIHGQNLESLTIDTFASSSKEMHPKISDMGMEYISRLRNLKHLSMACTFSSEGFEHLSKLENLRGLGLRYAPLNAKEFFAVLSELPKIEGASFLYADFSQPIDDETFKAIASLNGRLESLSFGEWQETTIHASILPAIAEIESLTVLDVGCVEGSLPPEQKDCLARLPYLERMTPVGFEVVAMEQFRSRDTFPVEFRPVKSPSGMMALLKYLLGDVEAAKVRREVVRRRAGISALTEDFTQSRLPVSQILNESFGVTFRGGAWRSLQFIAGQYRELDQQIRRYLSGMEIEPVED